jgi:hypothetical protein
MNMTSVRQKIIDFFRNHIFVFPPARSECSSQLKERRRMYRGSNLLFFLLSTSLTMSQDTFIVVKKKDAVSVSKLKEQAVDQLGDTLRSLPALMRQIADIQEYAQKALESYICGSKGCFWDTAGKEQLRACCTKTEHCNQRIEVINRELADLAAYLKKMG